MKVSTSKPFKIVYSLYQHEFLGYLFESFAVQLDDHGKLTLQHQNISAQNARDFATAMDTADFALVELMDSLQQETVIKKFFRERSKRGIFLKRYIRARSRKMPYRGKFMSILRGKEAVF
jgi:hypothetical protein